MDPCPELPSESSLKQILLAEEVFACPVIIACVCVCVCVCVCEGFLDCHTNLCLMKF